MPTSIQETGPHPSSARSPSSAPPEALPSPTDTEPQEVIWGDLRYEVPGSWEITSHPDDDRPDPKPFPVLQRGYCDTAPNRSLAFAVLHTDDSTGDAAQAVGDELRRATDGQFEGRDPSLTPGELTAAGGWASITGVVELAPSDDPCDNDTAMFAIKGGTAADGAAVNMLVVVAELDHPDSPTIQDLVTIANSLDVIE